MHAKARLASAAAVAQLNPRLRAKAMPCRAVLLLRKNKASHPSA